MTILLGLSLALLVRPTNQTPTSAQTIPMYVSARRALVMLRVGDHPPAPVVFDTGTNGNLLDLAYARRLGLPETGPSHSVDGSTGKPVPGFTTTLARARLGGVPIDEAPATVFEYPREDEVGIFGPNSFPNRLVTIDFAKSRIRIEEKGPDTIPKVPSFPYGDSRLPELTIDLAGTKVKAVLDTGNDASLLLPLSLASKLPLKGALVESGSATSAAGTQPIYRARLKGSIRIASVELKDTDLYFMKGGSPNVGLPVLRKLALTFDPTEGRTWVLSGTPTPKK